MTKLDSNVRGIRGVGTVRAEALERLNIRTTRDLLYHFPRTYEDRTVVRDIRDLVPGEEVCVRATVTVDPGYEISRTGRDLVHLRVSDDTGTLALFFWNRPDIRYGLKRGQEYIFFGRAAGTLPLVSMTNPIFERPDTPNSATGRIMPVYRLTAGITQGILRSVMQTALSGLDELPSTLPESLLERLELCTARFALEQIHFPEDTDALEQARKHLIFEELLVLAAALRRLRRRNRGLSGLSLLPRDPEPFFSALPFNPTGAQRRVIGEIMGDMSAAEPMNRLVQGDVGSGKTLVAAAAVWHVAEGGAQSAFMAPTEILARQHYATLREFLAPLGVRIGLLTGSLNAREKREIKELLLFGELDLIIGTHALISEDVEFAALALVITDEQHRFGVKQRARLTEKGESPHVLVMSATPIPRTLALIIYGDLDVSVIDEMPPGREPVDTFAVGENMRQRIMAFIRRLVGEGRQVFIVCPAIEESDELPPDMKSALEWADYLASEIFPELRIGCVHGRMKQSDADREMRQFAAGEYDILVSTTVIEVGVDIPNAALMIVENAERFGLSQLHQLRGRVGRGSHKSYCVLFSDSTNADTQARLRIMCETSDGFKISEEDLRLRGPGDFFGSRQHGLPEMHIADLGTDMKLLRQAQTEAESILSADPELESPEHRALAERVAALDFSAGN